MVTATPILYFVFFISIHSKFFLSILLGELTVDCVDPDGEPVPVNLTDNYDGTYRLRVKPVKPGKHILNIRLNKQHVFGK